MEPVEAHLCSYCGTLVGQKTTGEVCEHYSSLAALRQSSSECHICCVLLHSLERVARQARGRFHQFPETAFDAYPLSYRITQEEVTSAGLRTFILKAGIELPNKFRYSFHVTFGSCHVSCKPGLREWQRNADNIAARCATSPAWSSLPTGAEERVNKISEWLRSCRETHPECQATGRTVLPTRLVEFDLHHGGIARLVASQGLNANEVKYSTLSYCWGGALPKFCLTRNTIANLEGGVSISDLPRTLADAIYLTWRLGVHHIWIDVLCIVQHDIEDWRLEASRMSDVYLGSSLNLAASEADSPDVGLFLTTCTDEFGQHHASRRELLKVRSIGGQVVGELLVHILPKYLGRSALHRRGWTFQENVLSRRVVQMNELELSWQCRSTEYWETGIRHASDYGHPKSLTFFRDGSANRAWRDWIQNYSERRLTFESDRVPALIGIIKLYQDATLDEFCLGVWKSSFHEDLAWSRNDPDKALRRLGGLYLPTRFPSWSPFSCVQGVCYDQFKSEDDEKSHAIAIYPVKILELVVTWSALPLVSDLLESTLHLSGPVQSIYLAEASKIDDCIPPYFELEDDEAWKYPSVAIPWRCRVQWDLLQEKRLAQRWLCLLLQRREDLGRETFMVLNPVTKAGTHVMYSRVGLGTISRRRMPWQNAVDYGWRFDLATCSEIRLI